MRDWFAALRSGGKQLIGVPGVLGVLGGKISLKIGCWGSETLERNAKIDMFRCSKPGVCKNDSTPATPGESERVPLCVMEKALVTNGLDGMEQLEHQGHQEKPECGDTECESSPMVSADQLSPAERAQFCLDHELTQPGACCQNKNKVRGCLLWEAILERRLVRRPRAPDW